MKKIVGLLSSAALMLLVGCASQTMTGATYNDAEVGQAQIVRMGRIESVRPIKISLRPTGLGSMAGAAAGGVVGSEIGRGNGSVLGSIAGVVAGGVGGAMLEKDLNTVDGQELTVRLEDNSLISVAQEISKETGPLSPGEKVRILSSPRGKTRVVR
jgi:outer membrane lipoprotein SlyB